MFDRIAVIGGGSWGTALAVLLAEHGVPVDVWAHSPEVAEGMNGKRSNEVYLPGIGLPANVRATSEMGGLRGASLFVVAVPSKSMRGVAGQLAALDLANGVPVVSCTKGIEFDSGKLMGQVLGECLPQCRMAVLSGPNLAQEVARRIPAASVVGSAHVDLLEPLQRVFSVKGFRAYTSDDVTGIQLGGALKNIYAIAAGVSDGFGMGDNAKAALVTRSLAEMTRLGVALGGRKETFFGLSGMGDLMVTCFSGKSRNRAFGERVGRGEKVPDIVASVRTVAEGVPTVRSACQCAGRFGIDAPITAEVFSVVHEGKPPMESLSTLLGRPPKPENEEKRAAAAG
ncbi:MAG: NAD(P)-dependent glycerol-3-phosphate dehydrogenase [Verrucomicrobia bacterium]|nr:NAD(P)-dependent glycerol-3-phosphate dehydrogenase [Verrucomicrobiota bacterium]